MSDGTHATRCTGGSGLCHRVGEVAKGKGLEVNGPNVWSDGIAANQGSNSGLRSSAGGAGLLRL